MRLNKDLAKKEIQKALDHGFAERNTRHIEIKEGFNAEGNPTPIARQVGVSEYVSAKTQMNTPDVIKKELKPPEEVKPYFISKPIDGTKISSEWREIRDGGRKELIRLVGKSLARLHNCVFEKPGTIVGGDSSELRLETSQWSKVLDRKIGQEKNDIPERFSELEVIPSLRNALKTREETLRLDGRPASLIHEDPQPNNFFRDPPGFIDGETSVVGDPTLDVARVHWSYIDHPETEDESGVKRSFYDGYREVKGSLPEGFEERIEIYNAVTFLGTIRSFEQWAPEVEESTEDLAEWVRVEFKDRVNRMVER